MDSVISIVISVLKTATIAAGCLVSLAVAAGGVLTVAALLLGAEWSEHEDPADEAGEERIEECRHMAAQLNRGGGGTDGQ